jgi:hypothetical protein
MTLNRRSGLSLFAGLPTLLSSRKGLIWASAEELSNTTLQITPGPSRGHASLCVNGRSPTGIAMRSLAFARTRGRSGPSAGESTNDL